MTSSAGFMLKLGLLVLTAVAINVGWQIYCKLATRPVPAQQLINATSKDDPAAMEAAIHDGASPEECDSCGRTPLMQAAAAGNLRAVRFLLDRAVRINAVDPHGNSALVFAALYNHASTVQLLLDCGADPELRNDTGNRALESAQTFSASDAIKVLREADSTHHRSPVSHQP